MNKELQLQRENNVLNSASAEDGDLRGQVVEAQARRKELHDVNRELKRKLESALQMQRSLIERLTGGQQHNDTASLSPLTSENMQYLFSKDHEISRRKLVRSLWQLFHSIRHPSVNNGNSDSAITNTENQVLSLIAESLRLSEVDGAVEWRHQSLQNLTDFIQKRLWYSQNPENCRKRRYIICDMRHGCGFGCQVHHLAYCLLVAFASRRTLVLGDNGTHWK
ncbi:hypothetical protein GCK32_017401 [Trichostrongylus colubriformis]|uniref:GT23 domain-containing protein n=1 Tax=Trichostrongylus colubriformis TaxID=6319 RepID=A0AAN8IKI2_TRICO